MSSSLLKKISDLPINIVDGDRGKSYPNGSDFTETGYCLFLNAGNVTKNGFNFSEKMFITKEKSDQLRKGKLQLFDTILTTRGTVGNVAFFDEYVPFENLRINSGMVILRTDVEIIYPKFLYYTLTSPLFKEQVLSFQSGSAQPQLPITAIKHIKLPIPEIKIQKRTVKVLSDLDRKIELNRKMNETLEQIGQALFKKYFIDNPEREGWIVGQISDLAHHSKVTKKPQTEQEVEFLHYSLPAYDNGQVPDVVKGLEIMSNKFSVLKTSILVSKLNPNTPRVWLVLNPAKNAICSTEFVCLETEEYFSFLYFLINSDIYKSTMTAAAGGTSNSHKRVSPGFITSFTFSTPPKELLIEFENATKNLLVTINKNIAENQVLTEFRDSLLPKLISGQIKV